MKLSAMESGGTGIWRQRAVAGVLTGLLVASGGGDPGGCEAQKGASGSAGADKATSAPQRPVRTQAPPDFTEMKCRGVLNSISPRGDQLTVRPNIGDQAMHAGAWISGHVGYDIVNPGANFDFSTPSGVTAYTIGNKVSNIVEVQMVLHWPNDLSKDNSVECSPLHDWNKQQP